MKFGQIFPEIILYPIGLAVFYIRLDKVMTYESF